MFLVVQFTPFQSYYQNLTLLCSLHHIHLYNCDYVHISVFTLLSYSMISLVVTFKQVFYVLYVSHSKCAEKTEITVVPTGPVKWQRRDGSITVPPEFLESYLLSYACSWYQ